MTDPTKKPDAPNFEGSNPHTPGHQTQGTVPDWIDSMTGPSLRKEPTPASVDPFAPVTDAGPGVRQQYAPPGPTSTAPGSSPYSSPQITGAGAITDNKKIVAGILAILLGSLGVHKFYLGIRQPAIIMLCVTLGCWLLTVVTFGLAGIITIPVLTAAGIIGLVEGIIYLTKTDAQFHTEYEVGKKPWF